MARDPGADRSQENDIDLASLEAQRDQIAALEEIVAFLVHELRNPLAVVKGFATALEEATDRMDEDMMRSSATAIRRNAENLNAFVDSLSDVYSLTADKMKLNRSETLVSELIHETVTDLSPLLNGNPIEIHIEDDAYASVDRVRFRQALTNLLTNAVKYGATDEPIEVIVTREGATVKVCVADRGPGIPPERRQELFKKFSRLSKDAKGMGVGLFISRGIARAHGGDLYLDDSEVGCRFVIELPAGRENGVLPT